METHLLPRFFFPCSSFFAQILSGCFFESCVALPLLRLCNCVLFYPRKTYSSHRRPPQIFKSLLTFIFFPFLDLLLFVAVSAHLQGRVSLSPCSPFSHPRRTNSFSESAPPLHSPTPPSAPLFLFPVIFPARAPSHLFHAAFFPFPTANPAQKLTLTRRHLIVPPINLFPLAILLCRAP